MSEYLIRYSEKADIVPLTELWQSVFGDGAELISAYFRLLWAPERCIVAELDGELAAMGHCLPGARAGGLACSYIYAMATLPAHRGRGLAERLGRRLCEDAFRGGADICATLPADAGLCGWYERKLGMRPLFKKGGEGVAFPDAWLEFAELCGEHSPDTPARLWALAGREFPLSPLEELGWECTFD